MRTAQAAFKRLNCLFSSSASSPLPVLREIQISQLPATSRTYLWRRGEKGRGRGRGCEFQTPDISRAPQAAAGDLEPSSSRCYNCAAYREEEQHEGTSSPFCWLYALAESHRLPGLQLLLGALPPTLTLHRGTPCCAPPFWRMISVPAAPRSSQAPNTTCNSSSFGRLSVLL